MPETPAEAVQAAERAVRDGVRIHLGENALALAAAGQPLMLSGAEAEHAARLALTAAAPFLAGVGSPASCPSAADIPTEAVQAAARANSEHYEVCGERDCGRCAMIYNAARRGLDAALRVMAGVGSPVSCPSAAPESTQSPESTSVAPVYPPTPEGPAESLSALRPHPHAATLRQRYANAIGFAPCTPFAIADAVLAVRDDELSRALRIADYHADQHQQAADAIARVRELADRLCQEPHPTHDHICPDGLRAELLAALDGAGAVSEEQTGGGNG